VKASPDQLDRIREATNIVDLVSEHVRLKKRGRNFVGLCPFHTEKTASFNVLEDRGIFKCFGCGKGGDVFSFVMQLEGLTFPEAIQKLAKRANIELEGSQNEEEDAARSERESIYHALREAAAFYYRVLRSPEGSGAMNYLRNRGLDDDIMRKFGLGYAPERSGLLIDHLVNKGIDADKLERAGLIAWRDSGDYYERFRGRVIFPVFNATGRIVGFGGRIMPNAPKDLAKYINSPDTQIYHKSQVLYGLFQGKDSIRKAGFAILVEGYADVLAVFQSGIENVVAASGTSLTVEQLKLLKRYTNSIVLLFDADTAGKNATMRGIELAIEAGFDVYGVVLPSGEDPDSFIRLNGKDAFEAVVKHRQPWLDMKALWFEEQGSLDDPARLAIAARSIIETIHKVPDEFKRAMMIDRLSLRFKMLAPALYSELSKSVQSEKKQSTNELTKEEEWSRPMEHDEDVSYEDSIDVSPYEGALLEAMLADPIAVDQLIASEDFDLNLISHPQVRELLSYLIQRVEEDDPPNIAQLLDEFRGRPEFESLLTNYGMVNAAFSENWDDHSAEEGASTQRARQAIEELQRGKIARRQSELSSLVRKEGYSDDHLREILASHERPEMQKKHIQQIGGEAA
jgi:DNA primase